VLVTNLAGSTTSVAVVLSVLPDLAEALNATNLTWTTGSGEGWFRRTSVAHDGVDSATCFAPGLVPPYAQPWMQTSVIGPGTLRFWWVFPALMLTTDGLQFSIDGVEQDSLRTPLAGWLRRTFYVGAGPHTLTWSYVRGGLRPGGPAGVDQVVFTRGGTAAFTTSQPISQTAVAGSNVAFSVVSSGTPPLSYQWRFNGQDIPDATNSTLALSALQPSQAGVYLVTVSNGYGAPLVSSNATLTVTPLPLPTALDYLGPPWGTSGAAPWFGQVGITHDGTDAAQSGAITNSQRSVLSTTLTGPGTLSFWWKVSSATNHDFLRFSLGGVAVTNISGEVDWQQQTFAIPDGPQPVTWAYTKSLSVSRGWDAAWVDQITYDGPPTALIQRLQAQQLSVSWPTNAPGFSLQSATHLISARWQNVTDAPVVVDDNWVVTRPAAGKIQVYRLKR
jgi:hypothetical protein